MVEAPPDRCRRRRTYRQRTRAGGVGSQIDRSPILRGLQRGDRIDLPSFQHLAMARAARDRIGERERQPVTNVEIAVGILRARTVRVLGKPRAVAEVPVRTHVVGGMRVGVAQHHA